MVLMMVITCDVHDTLYIPMSSSMDIESQNTPSISGMGGTPGEGGKVHKQSYGVVPVKEGQRLGPHIS